MPAQVSWHLENRIVGIRLFGDLTLDDVTVMSEKILTLFDESDSPLIHLLVDEGDMTNFPKQFRDIYRAAEFLDHPQLGWAIFYNTDNWLIKFIAHTVSEFVKMRHRRFGTRKEALDFLQATDGTLPNLTEVTQSESEIP